MTMLPTDWNVYAWIEQDKQAEYLGKVSAVYSSEADKLAAEKFPDRKPGMMFCRVTSEPKTHPPLINLRSPSQ